MQKDKISYLSFLPLVIYNGQQKYSAPLNLWELFSHSDLAKKAMIDNYNLIDLKCYV